MTRLDLKPIDRSSLPSKLRSKLKLNVRKLKKKPKPPLRPLLQLLRPLKKQKKREKLKFSQSKRPLRRKLKKRPRLPKKLLSLKRKLI